MLKSLIFFDLSNFTHADLFAKNDFPWIPLNNLKEYLSTHTYPSYDNQMIESGIPLREHVIIHKGNAMSSKGCEIDFGNTARCELQVRRNGRKLDGAAVIMAGAVITGNRVSIGEGVLVECGAMIKSPAVIGDCSEVRQGAYLRGDVLTGKRCILGHTTEVKHSIFLDDAKAGHFAYLGDSILGNNANLGAGTKFANLRFLPGNVTFMYKGEKIDTGRRKFGAILGDGAQTGCNSVTSPGTLLGKRAMLLPNATARAGYHPEKSILR